MIVLDASVVVHLLVGTPLADRIASRLEQDPSLHAPSIVDLEVAQALRRFCDTGQLSPERGETAIDELASLPVRRYPHAPLLERIWRLRDNLTAYDAAYAALAEALDATLLTRDERLARAPGLRARIELV